LLTLVRGLDKKKFETTCICPPGPLAGILKEIKGVKTEVVPMYSKWDFLAIHKIKKIIRQIKREKAPFILHCHGTRGGFLGRLAVIGSIKHAPKVVYTEHLWAREYKIRNPLTHFSQLATLWFLDLFTQKTIAVSGAVAEFLVEKRITLPEKVVVIYNGIKLPKNKRQTKKNKQQITIGFVGSLTKRKGVKYLIEAISALNLKFKIKNLKLLIVGEGEEKEKLQALAKKLGVAKKIEFKGLVNDIYTIYPTLDIYVQPSLDEAFGIAALEAMSVGVPVIVSRVGGLCEIINSMSDKLSKKPFEKTDCGILVPPANSAALTDAISYLIKEKAVREKLAKCGQKRAKLFTDRGMVEKTEKLYNSLIE